MSGGHWRGMFDSKYIGAWDLPPGKDVVVEIEGVAAEKLKNATGPAETKPVVKLVGIDRGFVLNKTNARAIASLYGNETSKWAGKKIAIYATTTQVGPELKDCIRVRPQEPK